MISIKKNTYTKLLMAILILMLASVACSQEPTPEPVVEEEAAPEEAAAPEDEPVSEEAAAPEEAPAEAEAAEPTVDEAAEVSQPIYSWGEVADRLWVLVGYGDALNPTISRGCCHGTDFSCTRQGVA